MAPSTEVFVLVIFLCGLPFFHAMLRDPALRGRRLFFLAYVLLTVSNVATVLEEWWAHDAFDTCEHLAIMLGAAAMLGAVVQLTAGPPRPARARPVDPA
ncbi:MAG: hypothetical protein K8W52_09440 [Deltaproteobacteria bacterium]|nr:hypothetical protein [Deltaproteobacteria bacterium]